SNNVANRTLLIEKITLDEARKGGYRAACAWDTAVACTRLKLGFGACRSPPSAGRFGLLRASVIGSALGLGKLMRQGLVARLVEQQFHYTQLYSFGFEFVDRLRKLSQLLLQFKKPLLHRY